jgi:hypothetical protein
VPDDFDNEFFTLIKRLRNRAMSDFEDLNQQKPPSLFKEFLEFIVVEKEWWLIPILVVLLIVGALVFFAGTGAAPFIYTVF